MILETKRLYLREMREADFADLCEMLCDAEVMYAYEHAFTQEEAQDWLHRQLLRYERDGVGLWAVIRKCDGLMIGQCGITRQKIRERKVWEIGYLFKKEYWNQGYASEATRGVKRYAEDVMKLDTIYSIIRDTNIASQHVAIANDMKPVDTFTKHYYHMDMPHIVYRAELHQPKVQYHVYLDGEFDAVRIKQKFQQMVISIGAILCDENGVELSAFYDTVYPQGFHQLTRVVKHMTGLDNETITSSRRLHEVMHDFEEWIHRYDSNHQHTKFYSFGPDDRRTIVKHCKFEEVKLNGLLDEVIDLQKNISPKIQYQSRLISRTLSLDDMKQVFGIHGAVEHNALNDARDLMKVHWAYLRHVPQDEQSMQAIINRKTQKAIESRIKQQKHFREMMQERFAHLPHTIPICYYPEVLEQLRNWEMRDEYFKLHFKKNSMFYQEREYDYEKLHMQLSINTQEEFPSVTLALCYEEECMTLKYLLDYRNATSIEGIVKRCGSKAR